MKQHDTAFRARLSADEQALAQMENDLDDAVRARDEAQRKMIELRHAMAQAVIDINDLTTRRDLLKQSIKRRHATLPARPLPTFPDEVLSMIFRHSLDHLAAVSNRTRQPFRCAAVCKRWRGVALAMSSLWTFIGVPVLEVDDSGDFWLHIVQQLLLRSGARALHIVVSLPDDASAFASYQAILSDLLLHCFRWRHFELHGASFDRKHLETLGLLRGRTPLLKSVTFAFSGRCTVQWPEELPEYLPSAPRLLHARFSNVPVAFDRTHPNYEGSTVLPATSLVLHEEKYDLARFAATVMSFPALTTLELVGGDCDRSTWPFSAASISLPELQKLTISHAEVEGSDLEFDTFSHILDALDAPKLRVLEIEPELLHDSEILLSRCGTTVEDLRLLFGYVEYGDYATILEPLHALREISFASVETLSKQFLSALRDFPTPIWPKLERIVLGELRQCDSDELLHFLRDRYPVNAASPAVCALLEVDTDGNYLEGTVVAAEIRLILDGERARRNEGGYVIHICSFADKHQ